MKKNKNDFEDSSSEYASNSNYYSAIWEPLSSILKKLFGTLIFKTLEVLFVIFFMLIIIFRIVPKDGYINFDVKDIEHFDFDGRFEMQAPFTSFSIEFTDEMVIGFRCNKVKVDGIEYSDFATKDTYYNGKMRIRIRESYLKSLLEKSEHLSSLNDFEEQTFIWQVTFAASYCGQDDYGSLSDSLSSNRDDMSIVYKENDMKIRGSTPKFIFNKGTKIELSNLDMLSGEIEFSDGQILEIENMNEFILCQTDSNIELLALAYDNVHILVEEPAWFNVELSEVSNLDMIATGNMRFLRSVNSVEKFELVNQYFSIGNSISNKKENLAGEISKNNKNIKASLHGKIDNGQISGFDLFPSFFRWYTENIMLIPLSLITAIIGGIGLIKKKE